jgi:hypothetical protein
MSIRLTVIGAVLIALGSSPPRIPIPRGDAGIPARLPTAPR